MEPTTVSTRLTKPMAMASIAFMDGRSASILTVPVWSVVAQRPRAVAAFSAARQADLAVVKAWLREWRDGMWLL